MSASYYKKLAKAYTSDKTLDLLRKKLIRIQKSIIDKERNARKIPDRKLVNEALSKLELICELIVWTMERASYIARKIK